MIRPLLSLAASLLLAGGTPASQFVSRVDSVRIDALVTANGVPVTGLTTADFEVRDNGEVQKITLLEAGAMELDVILALDMSGSLDADRLATLRRAGGLLLNGLRPADRAALLTFTHAVVQRQALTSDSTRVREALTGIESTGGTSLADAMYVGLTLSEASGRRPLLIVFSDGLDTTSWLSAAEVIDAAKRFETVVYGVSAASGPHTPRMLRDVASQSGGNLLQVSSRDLEAAFARILDEFRQRYLLSYTLSSSPRPGWHEVEVRVKRPGVEVRARPGYLVGVSGQRRR